MAATEKDQAVIAAAKELQHVPWSEEYEKMISGMLYVYYYYCCCYSTLASLN